jgi:menaquinol-cytochrome c reductase iron-sulfur subunit
VARSIGAISLKGEGRTVKAGPTESPDTIDRERRNFLLLSIGVLTSLMGLVLGIPLVSSLVAPKAPKTKETWEKVASLGSLPMGQPVRLNFAAQTVDAYQREEKLHSVWIIRHSPEEVVAFSPICTHLGCYFNWNPMSGHFECPCHASVFSIDGRVLAGPAPRPLDPLPLKIDRGNLYVTWQRFKVGIPERVPAQEA